MYDHEHDADRRQRAHDEAEYQRGANDVREAQQAGPPGSPEREAAYAAMEQAWQDEGFDG